MRRVALVTLTLALALTGCQKAPSPLAAAGVRNPRVAAAATHKTAEIQQLTVQQAAEIAAGDKAPLFIDVREPDEYAGGHARGAVSYPLSAIETWAKTLDANAPVMVICHSGRRSMIACQNLQAKGFAQILNVQGGTAAWIAANLPIDVPAVR